MAAKKRASEKEKPKSEPKAKSAKTRAAPKASMSRCKNIAEAVVEVNPPDPISKAKVPSKQSNLLGHMQIKAKEQAQSLRSDNEQKDRDTGRVGRR